MASVSWQQEVEHELGRPRPGGVGLRAPLLAAAPRVAHLGHEPGLEERAAPRVGPRDVDRAVARLGPAAVGAGLGTTTGVLAGVGAGLVSIAVNGGDAAQRLGLPPGARVTITALP